MTKKILIVDDEEDVVEIIKTTMKTKGYQTISAYDGEEGYKRALEELPDLIILDLMMPKVSGLELCRRLRREAKTKDIPLVVMSALGKETGKSEDFWKSGLKVEEFISKPFDTFDLLGRVETIFRADQYLSKQMESLQPTGAAKEAGVETIRLDEATPNQVVKAFIEAWNTKNFLMENKCLGEEMHYGIPVQDYIGRRMQAYYDDKGEGIEQKLIEVIDSNQSSNLAKVTVKRKDTRHGKEKITKQQYVLKKTKNGWKIIKVKSVS